MAKKRSEREMERIRRREEREREREQEKRDREKRMRGERERDRERYVLELFNCQVPCSLYLFSEITLLSTWARLVFLRTLATVFIKNWRL